MRSAILAVAKRILKLPTSFSSILQLPVDLGGQAIPAPNQTKW
jgi:hypothetical protein